ncbi:phosphatidylinositol 3 [Xylariaceae sp. FL1019]|nr:phosphatidylinositol 3 [Xylariaceae sp. FL1019]
MRPVVSLDWDEGLLHTYTIVLGLGSREASTCRHDATPVWSSGAHHEKCHRHVASRPYVHTGSCLLTNGTEALERGSRATAASGIDDLLHIFKHEEAASDLSPLNDKNYHQLFEAIFQYTLKEKEAYYKPKSKTGAAGKLARCAELLRVSVEHGAPKIRRKTLLAVIDHITDILPHSEDGLVLPLVSDCIRTLAILLGHGANVELLATQDSESWFTCVDFVVQLISQQIDRPDDDSGPSRASPTPSIVGASMSTPLSTSRSLLAFKRGVGDRSHSQLSDLMGCLLTLVSGSNAPLLQRCKEITTISLQVLQLPRLSLGRLHQRAFAIINALLVVTQTDDTTQASYLATECLPLLTHWWRTASASNSDVLLSLIRTEMLKVFYNIYLQLEFLIQRNEYPSLREDIESLTEILWSEYSKRDERAQLQQDDIAYMVDHEAANQFRIQSFSLRCFNGDGERQWAIVHIIALLEGLMWKASRSLHTRPSAEEQPRKRQRMDTGSSRLRYKLQSIDRNTQFTALQILPFFVSHVDIAADDIFDLISILVGIVTNKNTRLSTWTMIACASLAFKAHATSDDLKALWKQTWLIAVRSISMAGNCRAASFLLCAILTNNLLPYADIMEDIKDIITAADVSGPPVLVDSSIKLMTALLRLRNHHLPNASHTTNNHVVRWMLSRWFPTELTFISSYSVHVSPLNMANVIRAVCGEEELLLSDVSQTVAGPIAETLLLLKERESVVKYLLLLGDSPGLENMEGRTDSRASKFVSTFTDSMSVQVTKKLVAELFYSKLEETGALCDSWANKTESSSHVTPERLQSVIACITLGTLVLPILKDVNTRQSQETEDVIFRILRDLLNALSLANNSQFLFDCVLRSLRAYMPKMTSTHLSRFSRDFPYLHQLIAEVSASFRKKGNDAVDVDMDDDDFDVQGSQSSTSSDMIDVPRRESSVLLHPTCFYNDAMQRIHFLRLLHEDAGQVGLVPVTWLDEFLLLSDKEILSCRMMVEEMFDSDLIINPDDAQRVIERMGVLIGRASFQSCEVALNLCLGLMEGFMPIWCNGDCELSLLVGDLYKHYLTTGLSNNFFSPQVQMALSRMLLRLAFEGERFPEGLKMNSPKDSLLQILERGPLAVKFYVGTRLPSIFGRYVLKLHEEMFVDILNILPTDELVFEGIALRLFVLAEVAREWPTLLRRGIYHIFETPGKVPTSKEHATYCLKKIALTLKLDDPRQLFDLFSSQLLYTWLDEGSVEDIPFGIFGFSSLEELLRRAQAEAAALLVMRSQDDALAELARILGTPRSQLVQRNWAKILAYSMAHDISTMNNDLSRTGESRLRKIVGREPFLENVYNNYVDVIGTFISLIDQEEHIERYWAKDDNMEYAAQIMQNIKQCGHSDVLLGANQQPAFRPKYLTRQIRLLCSRTEYDFPHMWNSAMVVGVARRLFNSIHPALGPLYACSILRKIRVVICMAGPHAYKSYPLEMLLHSIRPYLADTECADDALGISQYLLDKGLDDLSGSPSFLAGYSLCTLTSLRVFLETSQSSTTQESQFKATMSKAQKFCSWLIAYLEKYAESVMKHDALRSGFRSITESAAQLVQTGITEWGTHESKVLLGILQDESSGARLLSATSRKIALELLCRQFTIPTPASSDFVRSDEEAQALVAAVWRSCQSQNLNDDYLAWVGRIVGRSFAASGHIDEGLLRESQIAKHSEDTQGDFASEQGLLSLLHDLTADGDCTKAGLAESALRTIVSEAAFKADDVLLGACQRALPDQLIEASDWKPYRTPPSDNLSIDQIKEEDVLSPESIECRTWPEDITVFLIQNTPKNIVLGALIPILKTVDGFAKHAFPYIIHLVLLSERKQQQSARRKLSTASKHWFHCGSSAALDNITLLVNAVLYLRTQQLPGESSMAERTLWLDLDLSSAAFAAAKCGMFKTALLLMELPTADGARTSRRSSAARAHESTDLLLDIFENIDDPDAYYGLNQDSSLTNILARLEYEKDGTKSLAFRGAQYDSHVRNGDPASIADSQSLIGTLGGLGLSGLSYSLLQNQQSLESTTSAVESTFDTARRLETWNLPAPSASRDPAVTIYKAYQAWSQSTDLTTVRQVVWTGFNETMRGILKPDIGAASLRKHLSSLAALTELNDAVDVVDASSLEQLLETFNSRSNWMHSGRYDEVSGILSRRDTTMSVLSQFTMRSEAAKVDPPMARLAQVKAMLLSSGVHRYHQAYQESLNIATSLTHLVQPSADLGLYIDSATRVEAAESLWDHGEMMSSIRMLQLIDEDTDLKKQTVPVSRSDLLAKTAYQISVAKLEKPDSIQKNYLQPALKELKGKADGAEAGKVYHQFAVFCDEQLQNPDSLEDLVRLQHLRQGKSDEVMQLRELRSNAKDTQARNRFAAHLSKAQQWLELDEQELRRVQQSRIEFVRLSLENYLLSLTASDEHNNDALRFTALWLERAGEDFANDAVRKYIDRVPTRKFAALMNQLTSRLLDQNNSFQKLLLELVYRICVDHPYHGMYQIWSGTRSKVKKEDEVARLRKQATDKVAKKLAQTGLSAVTWSAIDKTSKMYHNFALETGYKAGQKAPIKDSPTATALSIALAKYRIPPPTMQIELSADRDYSHIPLIIKLEPTMTIASGVSAPKIITIVGANGQRFKQLVKGGNDDLRQDAIMEQVFAAVSSVLKLHRSTRQRNLGIRTYKVLPLTSVSGLIEFVSNTIPLHDYLMPAHERYHPKDLKGSQCRKEISNCQTKSSETRLATYKRMTEKFHPVMRYFFMEYFPDPDDWFAKRTAYTRTTAAISILGHVLGLGDRHGHNILLDSSNGEVVHIDLGVAFETGRVLPVPELVPFRLTRDIVDGMGITKTEGVFRRCCEFTLDALREETYSIMTILDVLRYDPLYSWSISPVRVAKLQDTRRDETDEESEINAKRKVGAGNSGIVNEPSEADRALEVVRKKLSKTLSVTATVNDLINQATDERNLSVLYSGTLTTSSNLQPFRCVEMECIANHFRRLGCICLMYTSNIDREIPLYILLFSYCLKTMLVRERRLWKFITGYTYFTNSTSSRFWIHVNVA